MYDFEKTVDGVIKYVNKEIINETMNEAQEFAARMLVGRIVKNESAIKNVLASNGFLRVFGIVDSEGRLDVEGVLEDVKREISRKEKITFDIPFFGKYTFRPSDIDALYNTIIGEEERNYDNN